MFCSNCGSNQPEGARFCQNCGAQLAAPVAVQQPVYVAVKQKIPGRGMGITAMVLGIIGIVYGFAMLSIASFAEKADDFASNMSSELEGEISSLPIIPILIFSSLSIMALAFGASALKKGYKNGISVSGVVMGIIGIALYVIALLSVL